MTDANHVNYSAEILSPDGRRVESEWFKGKSTWKWSANNWKCKDNKKLKLPLIALGITLVKRTAFLMKTIEKEEPPQVCFELYIGI